MNVVLYKKHGGHWAMTERKRHRLRRDETNLQIGPSTLHWTGNELTADIAETSFPLPRPLRGHIRVTPQALQPDYFCLDPRQRHRWRPIAPLARINVAFTQPEISWSGQAYFDTNNGDAPLEADFSAWSWSRTAAPAGVKILYDAKCRDGTNTSLALDIQADGAASPFTPPPIYWLKPGRWQVPRPTRADAGSMPRLIKTLEDAPFYNRSIIETTIAGETRTAIHESLSLDRFATRWVKLLLPFRMPRL